MKSSKSGHIDVSVVVQRVSALFQGRNELLRGVNVFLPEDHKIHVSERVAPAEPRDDELPAELLGNFRNALQPLTKLSYCETIGGRKAYAFTDFGQIIARRALRKSSAKPTYGANGNRLRLGRHGFFYLLRIVKTSASNVATAVEQFLDHDGPARTCLCAFFAGAVAKETYAQGRFAVCSLVPRGKECSEDGDAYFAVYESNCRSASVSWPHAIDATLAQWLNCAQVFCSL